VNLNCIQNCTTIFTQHTLTAWPLYMLAGVRIKFCSIFGHSISGLPQAKGKEKENYIFIYQKTEIKSFTVTRNILCETRVHLSSFMLCVDPCSYVPATCDVRFSSHRSAKWLWRHKGIEKLLLDKYCLLTKDWTLHTLYMSKMSSELLYYNQP
jgi:hypothetical protein